MTEAKTKPAGKAQTTKPEKSVKKTAWEAFKADAEASCATVCEHLRSGKSLLSFADANGFPVSSMHVWLTLDEDRAEKYARAKEDREERIFESLDDVAEQAVLAGSAVTVAGLRLKTDTLKWKLARMNGRKYGDKLTQEHTGDGGGALQVIIKSYSDTTASVK